MAGTTTAFGPFILDRERKQLTRSGQSVPLNHRGYIILEALLGAGGEPVGKQALMERAWPGTVIEESNLTVQVSTLRRQLSDDGTAMIVTVPRVGYRLVVQPSPTPPAAFERAGPPLVAVLPFANHGSIVEDGYFADGVAEDIINALSRFKSFAVVSRGASFALREKGSDPRTAAAELGIRYALEGSIRRMGDRLRLTAQLVDVATGAQLWGERYDGVAAEIFAFQDRITESVVGVVEPQIRRAEIDRARRKPAASLDAYDLFLQALQYIHLPGIEGHLPAMALLRRASELDPGFALPPAHAAWIFEKRISLRAPPIGNNDVAECIGLAREALRLGAADPLVRAICGWVLSRVGGDDSGVDALRQAVAENPNNATILMLANAGIGLTQRGSDEAFGYAARAYELSPGAPEAYQLLSSMGGTELERGNYEKAIEWSLKSLATFNDWLFTYVTLTAAYACLDRMDEAGAMLARVRELSPHLTIQSIIDGAAKRDAFAEAVIPGLRKAGLPER
jgi:TolB-like protein/DNA-binding winged helix-turn-helix (wHTH) protein